jgi:DNA replication protein DnaC
MKPVEQCMDSWRETLKRCAERAEDPTFKANAERLRLENAEAEEASARANRKMELHAAGVPYRFWDVIAEPKDEVSVIAARDFLQAPATLSYLVLVGPVGRGKTTALAWACGNSRGARFVTAQDLVFAGAFDPIWKELLLAPVLAIDEIGAEHINDAYLASLYDLLNGRGSWQRKTLIAGNIGSEAFAKRYCGRTPDVRQDPLYDRLTNFGRWVTLPGESMRRNWAEGGET